MWGSAPPLPYKGVPVITCPVTGFPIHLDEAVWCNGGWVSPRVADDYSLVGDTDPTNPRPHPLWAKYRSRRRYNRPYPRRRRY